MPKVIEETTDTIRQPSQGRACNNAKLDNRSIHSPNTHFLKKTLRYKCKYSKLLPALRKWNRLQSSIKSSRYIPGTCHDIYKPVEEHAKKRKIGIKQFWTKVDLIVNIQLAQIPEQNPKKASLLQEGNRNFLKHSYLIIQLTSIGVISSRGFSQLDSFVNLL